jgi:hypothetical protein
MRRRTGSTANADYLLLERAEVSYQWYQSYYSSTGLFRGSSPFPGRMKGL